MSKGPRTKSADVQGLKMDVPAQARGNLRFLCLFVNHELTKINQELIKIKQQCHLGPRWIAYIPEDFQAR